MTVLGPQQFQYVVAQMVDQSQVLVAGQGLPATPQRLVVSEPVALLASPQQLLLSSPAAEPAVTLPTLAPKPQAAVPRTAPVPAPAPAPQKTKSPARRARGAGRGKLPVQVTTRPGDRADRGSVVVHMPVVLEMEPARQAEEPDVLEVPVISPEVPELDPTDADAGFEHDPPPVEEDPLLVDTKSLFVNTKMEVVENEVAQPEDRPRRQTSPASDTGALPSMPAMEDGRLVQNDRAGSRQDRHGKTPRAQKRPLCVMRPRQSNGRHVSAAAEKAGPFTDQSVAPPPAAEPALEQRAPRPAQAAEPAVVKPDQKKPTQAVLPTPRLEVSAPAGQNRPPRPPPRATRPTAAADARPKVLTASHLNILKSFRKLKRQQSLVGDQAGPTRKKPRVGGSSGTTGQRPPRDTDCESARPPPAAAARAGPGGRGRGRGGMARQRSLLVDDAGRKVSRAGVSVDTPLNDLLDSMLLTRQGSGGGTPPAVPQATDKFILENCAPRGGHGQPRRRRSSADSVLMAVEEPAETLTAAELAAALSRPSSAASRPASAASRPGSAAGDGPPSAVNSLCGSRPGSVEPVDYPGGNEPAGVTAATAGRADTAAASDGTAGADAVKAKQHASSEAAEKQDRIHEATRPECPKSAAAASADASSNSRQNVLNDRSDGEKHKACGEKLRDTSCNEKAKSKTSSDAHKVKSSSGKSKDKSSREKSKDTSHDVKSKIRRSSKKFKSVPRSNDKLKHTASSKVGPSPKSSPKFHPTKPGETGSDPSASKSSGSATGGMKPESAEKMKAMKKSNSEHCKSHQSATGQKPGHKSRSSASSRSSTAASVGGRSVGASATKAATANRVDSKRVKLGRADGPLDDCAEFAPPPEPDDTVNDPSVLISDLEMSSSSAMSLSSASSSRSRSSSSSSDGPAPAARASSSDGSPGPRLRAPPSPSFARSGRTATRRLSSLSSSSSAPAGRESSSSSAGSRSPSPPTQRQRPASPQLSPSKAWSLTATASRPLHLVIPPEPGEEVLLATWNRRHDPLGIGFSQRVLWQPPPRGPASPNISYCVLCWDGGDLLLCDYCDKAFHEDCYIGPMQDDERGQWRCAFCTPVPQLLEPDVWRKGGGRMNSADRKVARRLLMELYAAYYPCLYFRKRANLEKLPEFSQMQSPVSLDEIRDRLLAGGFCSLTQLLQELKRLMSVLHVLKKGTAPYKYLRELYELFDTFVRDNMPRFWEQLDDS